MLLLVVEFTSSSSDVRHVLQFDIRTKRRRVTNSGVVDLSVHLTMWIPCALEFDLKMTARAFLSPHLLCDAQR
jgi:hypothetical protein